VSEDIIERWKKALTPVRFRKSSTIDVPLHWNPFDSDYSRIVLSAPFRRLQDKSQVFPLEPNDFVRTRLTHSMEVSAVSRSMGVRIENWLIENEYVEHNKKGHIPSILATSALVHDIGNPPIGHYGEKSIQKYFTNKKHLIKDFTEVEKADFLHFDGNAQGLRLLLRLGLSDDEFSFNLTFPTLATMIKYPKDSLTGNKSSQEREEEGKGISFKKFGYFQAERAKFEQINTTLALSNNRHPLCFLLEAADDICYSVSDIEDGLKKGTISVELLLKTLYEFHHDINCMEVHSKLIEEYNKHENDERVISLIGMKCRIKAQQLMIKSAHETFVANHTGILDGSFDGELLQHSSSKFLLDFFKKIASENFNAKSVMKKELLGENVITCLLNSFHQASLSDNKLDAKTKEGKLFSLIASQFKFAKDKTADYNTNSKYLDTLLATDHICGMTDTFALSLYQELMGLG